MTYCNYPLLICNYLRTNLNYLTNITDLLDHNLSIIYSVYLVF